MEKFEISSEDCMILKAFKEASSLREASRLLGCDPAGLARRVQVISSQYGFLQKIENRWHLTSRGVDLVAWAEASIQSQKKVLQANSSVRIGAPNWFSEEFLIPRAAQFTKYFESKVSIDFSTPPQGFERALIEGSVDFVIACHPPETPEIEHKKLFDEEWVVIVPTHWKSKSKDVLSEILKLPFVRHTGINLDLFIADAENVIEAGTKTDNLIGIRAAVMAGLGWSIVPKILVSSFLHDKKISIWPYNLKVQDRKVCIWWLRNRYELKRQSAKIANWVLS